MKTTLKSIMAAATLAALLTATNTSLYAQKLPAVQEAGVRAPGAVKVDGKLTEWGDNFQAYNKATDIYYTMANNEDNLYFVVKSTNQVNNNKILAGGINITINTAGKKKDKDAFIIGFPVVNIASLRAQVMQGMQARRNSGASAATGSGGQLDSATIAGMRQKAVKAAKEIKLIGFKDIPDSVISIYNEYGLKAMMDFDTYGNLIVEMSVPLKYMHLSTGGDASFAYDIKLNGIQIDAIFPGASAMMGGMGGGGFGGGGAGGGGMGGGGGMPQGGNIPRGMADMASMISPTDFWAKYTLAKK